MIDWNAFYANGGYYGENDPQCYDDGYYEEFDKEVYEIKKDGMTRAERRAYNRMLAKQKKTNSWKKK